MNSPGHEDDALWSAYLDGTLDAQARARAEARLRASSADREALEAMRAAEAQLRATAVPDPGAAYWRDFTTRVEARVQPRDPARIYEKLAAWFVNGERVRWMRAAGALAGLTLVTYIGMRGFRPSELRMPNAPPPVQVNSPPPAPTALPARERDAASRDAPSAVAEGQQTRPPSSGTPDAAVKQHAARDAAAVKQRAIRDEAAAKVEGAVPQSPAPRTTYESAPEKAPLDEGPQAMKKAPGTLAIEPQPQVAQDRVGNLTVERKDLSLDARGGRRPSAADSIAAFLALSLRGDSSRENVWGAQKMAKPLSESKRREDEALRLPSPAPQPVPEVDRLLRLADTAEPYATDPVIRPHVETIALRLAEFARQDPRAATRARALMRNLAASSTTQGERATWEERLRQLPN